MLTLMAGGVRAVNIQHLNIYADIPWHLLAVILVFIINYKYIHKRHENMQIKHIKHMHCSTDAARCCWLVINTIRPQVVLNSTWLMRRKLVFNFSKCFCIKTATNSMHQSFLIFFLLSIIQYSSFLRGTIKHSGKIKGNVGNLSGWQDFNVLWYVTFVVEL